MTISDCTYEDLKSPSSARKASKMTLASDEDNRNPNLYLKQMQQAWREIASQHSGTPGPAAI